MLGNPPQIKLNKTTNITYSEERVGYFGEES